MVNLVVVVCPPTATVKHHQALVPMMEQAYPTAKFNFIWSIQPALMQWGKLHLGHTERAETTSTPTLSVMVNGEKVNNKDKLLHTVELRYLLAWSSWFGKTLDCVSVSHLIVFTLNGLSGVVLSVSSAPH